jgi:hypothetical protein
LEKIGGSVGWNKLMSPTAFQVEIWRKLVSWGTWSLGHTRVGIALWSHQPSNTSLPVSGLCETSWEARTDRAQRGAKRKHRGTSVGPR